VVCRFRTIDIPPVPTSVHRKPYLTESMDKEPISQTCFSVLTYIRETLKEAACESARLRSCYLDLEVTNGEKEREYTVQHVLLSDAHVPVVD